MRTNGIFEERMREEATNERRRKTAQEKRETKSDLEEEGDDIAKYEIFVAINRNS